MHSHGQVSKLWKTLKQARLKLSPPNKPRSSKSTLKTPGKLSTLNTAPTYLKKHLETTHGNTERTSQEVPFILQTIITQDESDGTKDRNWLHFSILDKKAFNECIKTLSNNKSPGPDGIVNELLVCYPQKSRKSYTCSSTLCGQLASRQKLEKSVILF